jgi:hypothetical protein
MRIAIVMFKRYLDFETGKITDDDAPGFAKETDVEQAEPTVVKPELKMGFHSERK